jgi:hypothetical protein
MIWCVKARLCAAAFFVGPMQNQTGMKREHLGSTPSDPALTLHRVNQPLRWDVQPGQPLTYGQVEVRIVDGKEVRMLLPQPRKRGKYEGVSLSLPQCDQRILDAAHYRMGGDAVGCCLSVPNTLLPPQLQLVNDHTFTRRLFGEEARAFVGQHYTLFVSDEMPFDTFEEHYTQLIQGFLPCRMADGPLSTSVH